MHPSTDISKNRIKIKLKRFAYILFLPTVLLPYAGYWASLQFGAPNFFAFSTVIWFYALLPVCDALIGKDSSNPPDADVSALSSERYYRYLVWLSVPISIASLCGGLYLFRYWEALNVLGQIGLILSFGTIATGSMINAAHELIHKPSRFEQRLGGLLLSLVCYPNFKIEHVRGHHVHVATPKDRSTSQYGQSLYNFLPRALTQNVQTAWQLEAELLTKRGKKVWSKDNELLRWYAVVGLIIAIVILSFGVKGLIFFTLQSFVAITILETVNYLEHYGLKRSQNANGRYERTTHQHSWNSNYLLTNLMMFQLQRHSDHHANPQRRYQVLRHFDDSPQLPAGYPTMILAALIPPLWMRLMNPRVIKYYKRAEAIANPTISSDS